MYNSLNGQKGFKIVGEKKPYKMSYTIYGNGEEKILFINGYLMPGNSFMSLPKKFMKPKNTVILVDTCGLGESEFKYFFSVKKIAKDIVDLLRQLKVTRVNVVSISSGCSINYEIGRVAPDLVKTMTLCCALPSVSKGFFVNDGAFRFSFSKLYSYLYGMKPYLFYSHLLFSHSYLGSPSDIEIGKTNKEVLLPIMEQYYDTTFNDLPKKVRLSYNLSIFQFKFKPWDKDPNVKRPFPILMFHGTEDLLCDEKTFGKIVNIIKPDMVYFCKDAGHATGLEDVDEFSKKTEQFFNFQKNDNNQQPLEIELLFNSNFINEEPNSLDIHIPILKLIENKIKKNK